ncbi:hypothetical protein F5882DRAFT_428110 [Hyaloscypha sp. PMI_1271]|nr:hypothetical protein F5882DRAFT_428110 [Hyaloscypha sp. PMI_1271]
MVTTQLPNQRCIKKPRRSHRKSRNGCCECKRRRVKNYSLLQAVRGDESSLPSSLCILSPSPNALPYWERSLSFQASMYATAPCVDVNPCSSAAKGPDGPTDTDLFDHYLQHTSRTLTLCQTDRSALQIDMPKLALQNRTVFHSILAVSAACLCHDMISKEPAPDTSAVNQVLMTGYQHYNLASERVRELISSPRSLKAEPLLASAVFLVPFATASQQINHWISSRSEAKESRKLLSTTPRDAIIIMRAIRTTLQTLHCDSSSLTLELSREMELAIDSPSPEITTPPAALAPSRTHVMVQILAATVQSAFAKLQQCLDSALPNHSDDSEGGLSACGTAFGILKYISSKTFSASNVASASSLSNPVGERFEPVPVPLPQVALWLRSFARRATDPLPTEPLTSLLLSFLVQAPQAYLDVSVLMFLAEVDSWWIGNLPVVTLAGMVNRYGDDFVTRLWPRTTSRQEPWWPGSMLTIFREVRRHQSVN